MITPNKTDPTFHSRVDVFPTGLNAEGFAVFDIELDGAFVGKLFQDVFGYWVTVLLTADGEMKSSSRQWESAVYGLIHSYLA